MDLEERIMELSRYGYACGQILAILLLDTTGEDNPQLVRMPKTIPAARIVFWYSEEKRFFMRKIRF